MLKKILPLLLIITSCYKPTGPYTQIPEEVDTTKWQYEYIDGGLITYGGPEPNNPLINTKWVLTKMVSDFSTTILNDTIKFITSNRYIINSDVNDKKQYNYYRTQNLVTLTFHNFTPINAMSCTTNGLGVGFTVINGAEFTYDYNSNQPPVKLWFIKL